jgi:hypothetical protein
MLFSGSNLDSPSIEIFEPDTNDISLDRMRGMQQLNLQSIAKVCRTDSETVNSIYHEIISTIVWLPFDLFLIIDKVDKRWSFLDH